MGNAFNETGKERPKETRETNESKKGYIKVERD